MVILKNECLKISRQVLLSLHTIIFICLPSCMNSPVSDTSNSSIPVNEIHKEGQEIIYDKNGNPIVFMPYELTWENSADSKLNLSFTLDKPAGKNGFVTVKDGHFIEPSGERFKIWGVNLTFGACFPNKEDAASAAAYLARYGINTVRLHFLDFHTNDDRRTLFNSQLETTRVLNPEQLDILDFFVYELKKAGIYININLNVGRTYRKGDGVPEYENLGFGKGATLFDDHLIELQKEYAKQLLTHVNPYTGNAYINEPAVVIVEIVNENSLIEAWFSGRLRGEKTSPGGGFWTDITPTLGKRLTKKYNTWLINNISPEELSSIATEAGVKPGAEIPRLLPEDFNKASKLRFHAEAKFIIQTERDFFTGMYNYLKNELGVQSMIAANSDHGHHWNGYALLSNTSLLDFVDGHVYWQHPGTLTDAKTGEKYSGIENTPMVNDPGNSTVAKLSRSAVEGKPYTVSETNHPFPNEYACEGIPIIGAYAALQDWDGIFYHALINTAPHLWNTTVGGSFIIANDPVKMANFAATGLMFRRGDLKPAKSTVFRGYDENDQIEGIRGAASPGPFYTPGFSPLTALIHKTRIRSFEQKILDFPEIKELNEINSETNEITWHTSDKNFVEFSNPKSEALIGYVRQKTSKLKHLIVDIENEFASISLISLDNQPIASSAKLLLVTTARAGLSGMEWNDARTSLTARGGKPTIIEVITGEITIKGLNKAKDVSIEPLDGGGNPLNSIEKPVKRGNVTIDLGDDFTVWYYIDVKR